jgi:predicted enzyme related to lactoylglutathione lyase
MSTSDPSRFVWYDLFTTDQAAAKRFYGDLLGWQYENWGEGESAYPMIKVGESHIGGIAAMNDPAASGPPHWTSYVSVSDVEQTCVRAEELGGKVLVAPTDIPEVGRFAVIADPSGATIAPFHSNNPSPPKPDQPAENTFCWSECLTTDSKATADFYSKLFGWRVEAHEMDLGTGPTAYHVFHAGENMVGGSMDLPPPAVQSGAKSHWLYYLMVGDVDASAKKATELGGAVTCPPTDIPEMGRFCVITDPQGAMVALYRSQKSG